MSDERVYIRVGQILLGTVKSFSALGTDVILPQGLMGHIPNNEISWLRKRAEPEEFFKRGQEVKTLVVGVKTKKSGKTFVTLSSRALEPNPWLALETTHPANSRATARVVDFLPFGATVQLSSGFHALLHDSEISWISPIPAPNSASRPKIRAADFLRIGETIDVIIQRCDVAKRKIWVSHKLTQPSPWDNVVHEYPPETSTAGFVVNVAKFGHFVQLPNGCVGLLHQSAVPEGALDEYGIGDEIRVRVLSVDDDQRRIALAIETSLASENVENETFSEGRRRIAIVNHYERNARARRACIAHYGSVCVVCGLDFGRVYGPVADGFIHVHHLRPISEIGTAYRLDAVRDLRPVCPNCHSVIHLRSPPFTIEEATLFYTRMPPDE